MSFKKWAILVAIIALLHLYVQSQGGRITIQLPGFGATEDLVPCHITDLAPGDEFIMTGERFVYDTPQLVKGGGFMPPSSEMYVFTGEAFCAPDKSRAVIGVTIGGLTGWISDS